MLRARAPEPAPGGREAAPRPATRPWSFFRPSRGGEPGSQWHPTILLSTAFLLAIFSHYIFKAYFGATVVKTLGARGIPELRTIEALAVLGATVVVLASKMGGARLSLCVTGVALLSSGLLLSAPWLMGATPGLWSLVLVGVAGTSLNIVSIYCLWMLLTASAPRRVGLSMTVFGASAQVGMLLSASFTKASLAWLAVRWLPLVSAVGYGCAFAMIGYALRTVTCYGTTWKQFGQHARAPQLRSLRDITAVFRVPYLRLLAVVVIVHLAYKAGLNWNIYKMVQRGESVQAAATMLTTFYQYSAIACLVAQLVLVPLAFRVLTPRWGLLVQPVIGGICLCAIAILPSAMGLFASLAIFASLHFTVNNCMREALYIPVPLGVKVYSKAILAMVVPTLGGLLAALLVLGLSYLPFRGEIIVMTVLLLLWLAGARSALRSYQRIKDLPLSDALASVDGMAEHDRNSDNRRSVEPLDSGHC